ncbi:putative DNA-binding domain-containing protein [Shewanella sp. VB17]|uniref:HvfC family RiPP maturation protein n=1 Tax=Shewanella sp. VB17 TaxID=2739432 RepID=UPI001565AA6D|nr:putative DNA-binding domain-containing protein [Shewanella sp. VB17]NRD73518.1 putative DNA-binding domain-containing protein [Shewanella sp. VB17]
MSFVQIQQSFVDYIKQVSFELPNGTDARRMKVYRELFFNNVEGFVSGAFPVLKTLYSSDNWLVLVQTFFAKHDCQTPIFIEIAQEFLTFLQTEYEFNAHDPVFMLELAHYEYMELVVAVAQKNPQHRPINGPIISQCICLSDTSRVLQYTFDVQHISHEYRPDIPGELPQFFCLYRDDEDEVIFLQLTPLSAQVLGFLSQYEAINYDDLNVWLVNSYPDMEKSVLEQGALQLLDDLADKGVVKQFIPN